MSQLPVLRFYDPITRLRLIALVCGAGWLSADIGLVISHVSWMNLSLMAAVAPMSVAALVLLIYASRRFKPPPDIQERKHVAVDLHESERNLRLVLDRVPAFVHTITPTGELEFVNQTMLEFFGK